MAYFPPQNIFIAGEEIGMGRRPRQDPWTTHSTGPYNPGAPGQTMPTGPDRIYRPPTNAGGSVINRLLGGDILKDVGYIAGNFAGDQRANRVLEGNARLDYDSMMLDRELNMNRMGLDMDRFKNATALEAQDARNRNEGDALKKLQQTAYIKGGGSDFRPPTFNLAGQSRTAPSFAGIAPEATTAEEIQGASDLQSQLMSRFKEGGSFMPEWNFTPQWNYQPADVNSYAKPGMAEQIARYGSMGTGILGTLGKIFGGGGAIAGGAGTAGTGMMSGFGLTPGMIAENASMASGAAGGAGGMLGGAGSKITGILGKAAPYAGAAMGTIGLMKDRGLVGNLMNGISAGAGYGSFLPGIGTLAGAGIGALVGGLRSLGGGPSQEEIAGRQIASSGRQMITSGATPQQMQEAQASGWKNPQDALALIVVRDKLAQSGKPPEMANQLMAQLHQAEKQGPQAVEQVLAQIMGTVQPPAGTAQQSGRPRTINDQLLGR